MNNNIRSIISQVVKINEKYNAIKILNGENFNIFSILNMERNEVETHSMFIYELLNPKGSHNKGDLFLRLFMDEVLDIKDKEYNTTTSIKREDFTVDGKRIDFTIETNHHQIGIEMKIDAGDQKNQLVNYRDELDRRCNSNQEIKLYYLTLTGYEANSKSTNNELEADKDYILISFQFEILNWLDKCIEKSATVPVLREGLIQYRNLISKITNQLPNEMEQEMEDIIRDIKDVEAMQTIVNEYPKIWAKKELEFWDELWDNIEKSCDKYELIDYVGLWFDENYEECNNDEAIKNILERRATKEKSVGFSIQKTYKNKTWLDLTIMEWDDNISIRISFYDKNDEMIAPNNALEEICKNIGLHRTYHSERFKYIDNKITFYSRGISEPTYGLFCEEEFNEHVQLVANEVIKIVEALSKQENKIKKLLNEQSM